MTLGPTGIFPFRGVNRTVAGPDIIPGIQAPDFVTLNQDWLEYRPLRETRGKVRLLASVPSLENAVCDRETRRFNQEASHLDPDIHIFRLSVDLPFTKVRWCGATGVERITTLADHVHTDFGRQYGTLLKEVRLLRRADFVVGRDDIATYADYMSAMGVDPDYQRTLFAIHQAI
jgi:thiol peroxidase